MINKVRIQLLEDLTELQFRLSKLRQAKHKGDMETINHHQLGHLYYQRIKFAKIEREGIKI